MLCNYQRSHMPIAHLMWPLESLSAESASAPCDAGGGFVHLVENRALRGARYDVGSESLHTEVTYERTDTWLNK